MFNTVADEDFGSSHEKMMKHISGPMQRVVQGTLSMVERMIEVCEDGRVSPEEKTQMEEDVRNMPALVAELQQKVKLAASELGAKKVSKDVLGEHYAVLTICYLAQLVVDQSKFFLEFEGDGDSWLQGFKNAITSLVKYDKGDLRWALRSSFCLIVNFLIGWKGWCSWSDMAKYEANPVGEAPACFINQYTAGLANINVVLLSRSNAGTLKAALERVAAVVFATVVGQVGYVALGWCDDLSRALTGVAVFFVCWGFLYFTYDGDPNTQGIAQRLAAITVASLMADCSDKSGTASTYSASYHSLSEIILGVLVMTFFDTFFGEKPASEQAKEVLLHAIEDFKTVCIQYFNNEIDDARLFDEVAKVQSHLAEARSQGFAAVQEPRFWRASFNATLYDSIVAAYSGFCMMLLKINHVLEDDKDLLLVRLDSYPILTDQISKLLHETTDFAKATILRDEESLSDLISGTGGSRRRDAIEFLIDDMNKQTTEPKMKDRVGEMHVNPDCRRCAVATMLQSLLKGMQDLQSECVKYKHTF